MKQVNHIFVTPMDRFVLTPDTYIHSTDICCICNRSADDIDRRFFGLTVEYVNINIAFSKCLTEEEYIIKKALE